MNLFTIRCLIIIHNLGNGKLSVGNHAKQAIIKSFIAI